MPPPKTALRIGTGWHYFFFFALTIAKNFSMLLLKMLLSSASRFSCLNNNIGIGFFINRKTVHDGLD
jgi:hypothetical protein